MLHMSGSEIALHNNLSFARSEVELVISHFGSCIEVVRECTAGQSCQCIVQDDVN